MDVGRLMFDRFLANPQQIKIPIYQREYSWEKKQWEQLFKDVEKVGSNDRRNHFIGSLVYTSKTLNISKIVIIDGQQRITTLSLLIAAIANCLVETPEYEDLIGYKAEHMVNEYLFNVGRDGTEKYKLWLTKDDAETYNHIIENILPDSSSLSDEDKSHQIFKAYDYFNNKINERNIVYIWNGIKKLQLVYLNLEEGLDDSPQEIFESLNATGLKLSDADLIRNFILMDLEEEEQQNIYNAWHNMEKVFRKSSEFEDFIKHYLTVKRDNWVPDEVYEEFKKFKEEQPIREIIEDVRKYLKIYKKIVFYDERNQSLKDAFKSIDQLSYNVIRPFLMKLYEDYEEGELSRNDFIEIIEYSESFLFRRKICDKDSQSIKGFFDRMHKILKEETSAPNEYLEYFKYILRTRNGKTSMPNDALFEYHFKSIDLYKKKGLAKYVLVKLTNYQTNDDIEFNTRATIEHIMPQNLTDEWKNELGSDGSNWEETHTNYLHVVGNLTLTSSNSELGTKTFMEKRTDPRGYDNSNYNINKYFKNNDIEHWNKEEINTRSELLFEKAKQIWKLPETPEIELNEGAEEDTADTSTRPNIRYWTMCKKYIEDSPIFDTNQTPRDRSNFYLSINSNSAHIELKINSNNNEVKTQLIINDKELYAYLERQKPEIKNELLFDLDWESLESRISSTITVINDEFDLEDDLEWKKSIKWQIDMAEKFHTVFHDRIQEFRIIQEAEEVEEDEE